MLMQMPHEVTQVSHIKHRELITFFPVFLQKTLLVFWHGCSCVKTSVQQLSNQVKSSGI